MYEHVCLVTISFSSRSWGRWGGRDGRESVAQQIIELSAFPFPASRKGRLEWGMCTVYQVVCPYCILPGLKVGTVFGNNEKWRQRAHLISCQGAEGLWCPGGGA